MTTALTLAASLGLALSSPALVYAQGGSQGGSQGPDKQADQKRETPPQSQKGDKPKAELPKLPPSKTDALDELLKRYGSDKPGSVKTGSDKTGAGKGASTPREGGARQPAQDERPRRRSKLDELDEIVRKAREKRLAQSQQELAASIPINPFVGTWNIVNIARGTRRGRAGGGGYVIFTPAFVSMHIFAPGPVGTSEPRWQSSFRRYWIQGGQFVTSSMLGIGNQGDGESIVIEAGGRREARRFQFLAADSLRIIQGPNRYIDLRLIERF